jgi:hypothetical protein
MELRISDKTSERQVFDQCKVLVEKHAVIEFFIESSYATRSKSDAALALIVSGKRESLLKYIVTMLKNVPLFELVSAAEAEGYVVSVEKPMNGAIMVRLTR